MKNMRNIYMLLVGAALFTSCISEDPVMNPDDVENVVEFYATSDIQTSLNTAVHPLFEDALNIQESADLNITVNYAGAHTAPEDLTVTVRVNNQAVTAYNAWNNLQEDPKNQEPDEDLFDILPAELYTIPSYTVTIPKGQRRVTFTVKMHTLDFDLDANYALGLTIETVSKGLISANFSTGVFSVKAKNKYDGLYTLKSKMTTADRPTFSLDPWDWPYDVQLITTGANSVALFNSEYSNDYTHPIQTNTSGVKAWSRLGSFTPVIYFDASDKVVTVENYYAAPANGRAAQVDPSGPNERDAAGNIKVTFLMTQPGFGPVQFKDELIYVGPR